ncbi:hypothetical protein A7979_01690 [Rothia nasimurium]|uniref:Pentapeptide repeat-containing protein n=1 Tax=Rothia nasimurium TaxID=85336 RepID=A0A1Y1RR01_9MICC|nr:pentapeptide repeat-containing protein [Rothia nasimurium]ORC22217.1 hypothetical protein A7979_01690 [Rothia nasimurium]
MAKEPTVENRSEKRPVRGRDLSSWLVTLAWGAGFIIYAWLLSGAVFGFDYRNLIFNRKGVVVWCLAVIIVFIIGALSLRGAPVKKSADRENRQLFRIVVAVLPALFLVSALAVLTLTLTTYNADWKEARQGIATAFAALIAAVGVVVSVVVSYRTGEENRLAQQKNLEKQLQSQQAHLETQLEHQRALEEEKGRREQQKLDAELIKNLNDRLHEIIPRRYGDKPEELSASYFQLAALYKDWKTLAETSPLIALQKESQQRNILKLLFGVYQESGDGESSKRSEVDIRTLNSVIQDIFPSYQRNENEDEPADTQETDVDSEAREIGLTSFDLSYLDLRNLDLRGKDLRKANLVGAHLEAAKLQQSHLEEAKLNFAHLEGAELNFAHLKKANLQNSHLERATVWLAHLEESDLQRAHLEGAELPYTYLNGVNLNEVFLGDTSFFWVFDKSEDEVVRDRIINQLKEVINLPQAQELLKAKDFDEALVDAIIRAHKEHHRENQQ